MKRKYDLKIGTIAIVAAVLVFSSCTKFQRDDSFPIGDPPPVTGGFTNSDEIAKSNLVGYWAFNGSLIDSVTGVSAVNHGATFEAGKKGEA
ncbi:MAG: hypothetical protein ABI091_13780, partial [Ferruginibacter sp.]